VAAHYRVQGLTGSILPRERVGRGEPAKGAQTPAVKRGARLVSPVEVSWLVLSLPIWAFLSQIVWVRLPTQIKLLNLHPKVWQGILLSWGIAVGLLLAAGILRQLQLRRMRREEALLVMQDMLWDETRSEQRRIQGWLAWSRFGRRNRKERP
jgi:hypothetical protein